MEHDTPVARCDRRVLLAVFVVAIAAYLPNLWNAFAWDDGYLIVRNPTIHSPSNAADWFADPWSAGATTELRRTQNAHFWRPLVQASYAIDWAIGGGKPWLFHLTGNLLHGTASLLVALLAFTLCVRTSGDDSEAAIRAASFAALAAGALFAVHPVHSEPVNLACYRTTLLASTGVLAALYLHCRGGGWSAVLVPVWFGLGLMSKESAIVLPGMALVCDLALGRVREERWRLARRYAGMLGVAVAYLVIHELITDSTHFDYLRGASPYEKLLTMLSVLALYARLLVTAYPLTPFYDWSIVPIQSSIADPAVLAGLVLLLSLGGIFVWGAIKRRPIPILIVGLLFVPLAPYSHLIPFNDIAGERFLYLASAGACLGVGFAIRHAVATGSRTPLIAGAVAAVFLVGMVYTPVRATHFRSTHRLLVETAQMYPESFNAQHSLGLSWMRAGDSDRAVSAFERAHAIHPDLSVATISLVNALVESDRVADAVALLRAEQQRLGAAAPPEYADALGRLTAGGAP